MRATKLVCTIGPASVDRVDDLVDAGMDVARINCSHGNRDDRDRIALAVREAAAAAGRAVGVMADLSGPKVRLGELEGGEVRLERGTHLTLRADGDGRPGDARAVSTTYPELAADIELGDRIMLSDGAVELRVVEESGGDLVTEVLRGGRIRSRAGVNVPSERLGLPSITPKDELDLAWAVEAGADMVAQSFVRQAGDVRSLRALCPDPSPVLVAKVETRAAVEDAPGVVAEADAVMVARGDLGVETAIEDIPVIQRGLVSLANRAAKPVIIATQMLESMIRSPHPTRAEASDAAGAVFEGADAILLSGETAIGDHPIEAARTAARILAVAESKGAAFVPPAPEPDHMGLEELPVAHAAAVLAGRGDSVAVVCFTRTGTTARLLSAARPGVPIFAYSPGRSVVGRLTLFHGVVPFEIGAPADTDAMIAEMDARLRALQLAAPGENVVMVASSPAGRTHANLLKVHRVGS